MEQNSVKTAVTPQPSTAIPADHGGLRFGAPQHFSYTWLKKHAESLAAAPYQAPPQPDPSVVANIDYDAYGHLKYKLDFALYGDAQPGVFPITFMFVGHYFPKTVRMYAVEKGAELAREIVYDPNYFDIPTSNVARKLPADRCCFAGFWVREAKDGPLDWRQEEPWATFLSPSCFLANDELRQVCISPRGNAVTPCGTGHEVFP